jgi:hypothetical protein
MDEMAANRLTYLRVECVLGQLNHKGRLASPGGAEEDHLRGGELLVVHSTFVRQPIEELLDEDGVLCGTPALSTLAPTDGPKEIRCMLPEEYCFKKGTVNSGPEMPAPAPVSKKRSRCTLKKLAWQTMIVLSPE